MIICTFVDLSRHACISVTGYMMGSRYVDVCGSVPVPVPVPVCTHICVYMRMCLSVSSCLPVCLHPYRSPCLCLCVFKSFLNIATPYQCRATPYQCMATPYKCMPTPSQCMPTACSVLLFFSVFTIITEVNPFYYVIYSPDDSNCFISGQPMDQ